MANGDAAIVSALIEAAGLRPPAEEIGRLAELYGPMRRQLAMLWAADLDGDDPASVFRAGEILVNGAAPATAPATAPAAAAASTAGAGR